MVSTIWNNFRSIENHIEYNKDIEELGKILKELKELTNLTLKSIEKAAKS
jgi:hypothetical protein